MSVDAKEIRIAPSLAFLRISASGPVSDGHRPPLQCEHASTGGWLVDNKTRGFHVAWLSITETAP